MPKSAIRQGDVLVIHVADLPPTIVPVVPESGRLILARGEATGHHHSLAMSDRIALFREDGSGSGLYLTVAGNAPASLEHQEHSALVVLPGRHRVVIQRIYVVGIVWRAAD